MKINKILTSLLLLSLVAGLYNPIKAASNKPKQHEEATHIYDAPLTMEIYYNDKANKIKGAQMRSVTLIPKQSAKLDKSSASQTDKDPADIIGNIIKAIDELTNGANDKKKKHFLRFWMHLSPAYITKEAQDFSQAKSANKQAVYQGDLFYWGQLFNNGTLKKFTKLFFITVSDEEDKKTRRHLVDLAKSLGKSVLLFQTKDGNNIEATKVISAPSFKAATTKDNSKSKKYTYLVEAKKGNLESIKKYLQEQKSKLTKPASSHRSKPTQHDSSTPPIINQGGFDPISSNAETQSRQKSATTNVGTLLGALVAAGGITTDNNNDNDQKTKQPGSDTPTDQPEQFSTIIRATRGNIEEETLGGYIPHIGITLILIALLAMAYNWDDLADLLGLE